MAFQSVPETVEIATNYSFGSTDIQMTFHARKSGGYSESELTSLANQCDGRVVTSFLPNQANDYVYNNTSVRGLESITDLYVENSDGTGPGSLTADAIPVNCALAIKKLSGFTGRSARGRVYWFGLTVGQLDTDENYVLGAQGLLILGAVDAMRATIVSAGWLPVIVSRFTGGAKRATGVTFEWVSTGITDYRVDSRRDRLP